MQTSQLQSMLNRNAAVITRLIAEMQDNKISASMSLYAASKKQYRKAIRSQSAQITKLAAIQKAIKFDLHAQKLARLRQNGHRRTKHGMTDPRYVAWAVAKEQAALRA